ncbi:MAG: zinc metallopeptidase [Chloroflexi bacterium]|nr:zinc metallopeptidase [Chloroflexota bacterium]
MFFWDPMYLVFALPALLLGLWAQSRVQSAYSRYMRVANSRGLTGIQAAEYLLRAQGLGHVSIEGTPGQLTDHYDPRTKTLRLSRDVAYGRSLAGLSIVAHEVGHAVQDHTNYGPLKLRSGIVPMVTLSAYLGPILFVTGLLMQSMGLAWLGVILFSASAVFAVLTLPVEKNASKRALEMLRTNGLIVRGEEEAAARQVLDAAALTYVAALVQVISTLLYYVFLLSGASRRRD